MSLAILKLNYEAIGFVTISRCKDNNGNIFIANVLTDVGRKVHNPYNKKEPFLFFKDKPIKFEIVGNPLFLKKNKEFNPNDFVIEKQQGEKSIKLENYLKEKFDIKDGREEFSVDIETAWEQRANGYFYRKITNNKKDNELVFRNYLPIFPWIKEGQNKVFCFGNYCEDNILCLEKEGTHILERYKFSSPEKLKTIKEKEKFIKSITIHYNINEGILYLIKIKK